MVTGLILIIILQAVIVAWMVFVTMLIFAHDKNINQLDGLYDKVDKYAQRVEQIVADTANDKKFALETIQQTRRLQDIAGNMLKKQEQDSKPFKFDEAPEDPEEPRS